MLWCLISTEEDDMGKHVLDRPKTVTGEMVRRVVAVRRKALPRKASLLLQRRRRNPLVAGRLRHYLRMERES